MKREEGKVPEISIGRLAGDEEAAACARMMAASEPWITLGRGYEESLVLFRSPEREVWVARASGRIAGFAVLALRGAFPAYLQSLAVDPALRGSGVGARLLRFVEKRVFREWPNLFLCVSSFNEDARRFYERHGYRAVGEVEDYVIEGASEILLRKTIGPIALFRPGRTKPGAGGEER